MNFSIVVAIDQNKGIGKSGQLPWHIPADLKYFKNLTTKLEDPSMQNAVVMGRKTWESIPEKFRPLPDRINIVLTRDKNYDVPPNVLLYHSFDQMLDGLSDDTYTSIIENVFVIGGQQIFEEAVNHDECHSLWVTHILQEYPCDTYFPSFEGQFTLVDAKDMVTDEGVVLEFAHYQKI